MATHFVFDQDYIKAQSDRTASDGFKYICRLGKYAQRDGKDGRLIASGSAFLPSWAQDDALKFWECADEYVDAADVCYRQLIALPRGFADAQYKAMAERLVDELSKCECGHTPTSWALHEHKASDGGVNVHVHLERSRFCDDGIMRPTPQLYFARAKSKRKAEGGVKKSRDLQSKDYLLQQRQTAANVINEFLTAAGRPDRVSALRYEDQAGDMAAEIAARRERLTRAEWERMQRQQELARLEDDWRRVDELKTAALADAERLDAERQRMEEMLKKEEQKKEEMHNENRKKLAETLARTLSTNQDTGPTLRPH